MKRKVVRRPNGTELARRRSWAKLIADLELRLVELRRAWLPASPDPLAAEFALLCDDELDRVHAVLQGRLLRQAAEMCLLRERDGRLWTAAAPRPNPALWRREVEVEVQLALADRRRLDTHLLACQVMPLESWPPAEVLARAAKRILPGSESELLLARARFASGHRGEAESRYRAIARSGRLSQGRLHEAAGAAAEARGDLRLALERNLAARALGAGVRSESAAFVMACVLGERAVAAQLAEELESRESERLAAPREHARIVRELSARWRARGIAPRPATGLLPFVSDCICSGERGLADLCYAFFS